jgi:hypothetical protein
MAEPLYNQVIRQLEQAAGLYYRLTLVVAPRGAGKTVALQEVAARTGALAINVNLALSQRMLDLTERQRSLRVPRLLEEITGQTDRELVVLDNLEMLFEVALKLDPLRLLQGLARQRTVVAAWNGSIEGDYMTYAAPGHPEYRKYPVRDFLVASPEGSTWRAEK